MVGGLLKGDRPWKSVVDLLQKAQIGELKKADSLYQYGNLIKSMEASIGTLDETLQSKYLELCIFPDDTPIPISTISILWSSENTENWLFTLLNLNLIQKNRLESDEYVLHDLQMDFIRWKTTKEKQPTIHQKLINNLTK